MLDDDACYAALTARDRRFDGVFFVGVSTTGIYCRPICPARLPGRARCTFYPSAALAERAGFRACFRCRPEVAPGNGARAELGGAASGAAAEPRGSVDAIDALVASAARRIALNEGSVDALAAQLGVSDRHLRRAMEDRLGVSPVELAQTRRLALAKQLLQDTRLPLTEIAFASGFGSVRRFNAVFAARMGRAPRTFLGERGPSGDVVLRLDHREPYAWDAMLAFLRQRAIPGVEAVGEAYARVVHLDGRVGRIRVARGAQPGRLELAISPSLVPVAMPLVARVRRLFDLDAHPHAIDQALSRDPLLAGLVAKRPGLRVPGAIDPFEAAIRAMLGQQVSVAAATTLAGRFAQQLGTAYEPGGSFRFPTAAEVARCSVDRLAALGLPGARAAAIRGVAAAIADGALDLAGHDLDAFVAAAVALPGIGPWTAHYLGMRALHHPDAFPASDLGVIKALGKDVRANERRARAWSPFRAYAVMHLWHSLGAPHADDEDDRLAGRRAAPVRARRRADRAVPAAPGRAGRGARQRAGARARRAAARGVLRR